MAGFEIQVMHLDGSALVALEGELDVCGVPALRDALTPLLSRYDADQVTFECSQLAFMDAAGIGGLVRFLRSSAGGTDRKPHLRGVRRSVMTVLRITGVAAFFTIELADLIRHAEPFDIESADS